MLPIILFRPLTFIIIKLLRLHERPGLCRLFLTHAEHLTLDDDDFRRQLFISRALMMAERALIHFY